MSRNAANRRAYHRMYMMARYHNDKLHKLKHKARVAVGHAIRDGILTKGNCEVCNSPLTESHHDDYNKPLEVKWFCREHHVQNHGGPGCHG